MLTHSANFDVPTMLTIRKEQLRTLERQRLPVFIDRLVAHLQASCPAACAVFSADELRHVVGREFDRAAGFGLTAERDVAAFVTLMLVQGEGRDDPAWQAQVQGYLTDARVQSISDRVSRLQAATLKRLSVQANNRRILEELGLGHRP